MSPAPLTLATALPPGQGGAIRPIQGDAPLWGLGIVVVALAVIVVLVRRRARLRRQRRSGL